MKGIVLDTNNNEAAVLCDNGTVSKIKNKHYKKGQVVNMNNRFKLAAKAGSIAAALAISAVTGFAYTTPSTYVSLDVNPSIEYKLNAFDRVISVVAVNEDGEKIVNELDIKNDKITEAVLKTVEKLKEQGYLTEDDYSGIVIAVSNKNEEKSDKLADDIEEELNKDNDEVKDEKIEETDKEQTEDADKEDADDVEEDKDEETTVEDKDDDDDDRIEVVVEAVGRERVEEARKLNVTPGKLNLVQKLIASTEDFDDINEEQLIELLNLSVKEINKMTNAYRKGLDVDFEFEVKVVEEDKTVKTEEVSKKIDKVVDTEDQDNEDKDDDNEDKEVKNKVKEEYEKKNNGNNNKVNINGNNGNNSNKGNNGNNGNKGNNGKNKNN